MHCLLPLVSVLFECRAGSNLLTPIGTLLKDTAKPEGHYVSIQSINTRF
jgi:hypothetical protein